MLRGNTVTIATGVFREDPLESNANHDQQTPAGFSMCRQANLSSWIGPKLRVSKAIISSRSFSRETLRIARLIGRLPRTALSFAPRSQQEMRRLRNSRASIPHQK